MDTVNEDIVMLELRIKDLKRRLNDVHDMIDTLCVIIGTCNGDIARLVDTVKEQVLSEIDVPRKKAWSGGITADQDP